MIYTKKKNLNSIIDIIKDNKNVFVVGCADCATTCATGGEDQVNEMSHYLSLNGFKVTGTAVLKVPCDKRISRQFINQNEEIINNTDTILVLSCGSGVNSIGQIAPVRTKVRAGLDSVFLGAVERIGDFREFCSHCGECLINESEAICTTTRCSKGLINGPCGGAQGDRCEVDNERECIWIALYNKNPEAPIFKRMMAPRKNSRSLRPNSTQKVKAT